MDEMEGGERREGGYGSGGECEGGRDGETERERDMRGMARDVI